MEYNFGEIEKKWQHKWANQEIYKVSNNSPKPKYYVLDMFPYPSGAGLHVGHPLGYIASDIFSRYKRLKGFNVLHPMGYDAFGLPAEQYAIEHGVHPAISTKNNIQNFRNQLDKIGFCYDWSREVNTSEPNYYKWTQWIFLQLFNSYYNRSLQKAEPITQLIQQFEQQGSVAVDGQRNSVPSFTADEWKAFDPKTQQAILMEFRLAYCGYGEVNWCEALGTVLANDEVVNGVSERGGHPVVKKKLRQWYLRITEYADRLQDDLQKLDWSDAMKEMQTNWIGKSYGAEITFAIQSENENAAANGLTVYTTRPDTIFGVDFMVIAPEHDLVETITTAEQKEAVESYITYVKSRSDRERQAEKKISGCFTGAYAINPFDNRAIPIWISEYVLAGYGTGAIMAVPCGDERDLKFAKYFNIPVTNIIGDAFNGEEANPTKDAILENSGFLNGMVLRDAITVVIDKLEAMGIGKRKVNYKMRDAAFSRQRYWGEPFPITWKDGVASALDEKELPLLLPEVDSYSPGPEGEGPLANIPEWVAKELETNTMPGYAGSSWYFLRYMDPHNENAFVDRKVSDYWNSVDLYIGGTEHAVGHLLYSRMWTKVLYDLGHLGFDEPFKKLLNQGMITGLSAMAHKNNFNLKIPNSSLVGYPKGSDSDLLLELKNFLTTTIKKYIDNDIEDFDDIYFSYDFFHKYFVEKREVYNLDSRLTMLVNVPSEFANFLNQSFDVSEWYTSRQKNLDNILFVCNDAVFHRGKFYYSNSQENSTTFTIVGPVIEKMSKSKFNVTNPNNIIEKYGADTFRMYEMFLGPVEQSKPWDTKGIEGVHRFLKKLWRLFFDDIKGKVWNELAPTAEELKILHRTIKKIEDDTERFSFNTAVSAFMVCVNELSDVKCNKKAILEPLLVLLTPYAPHIAEELWTALGNTTSVIDAAFPVFEAKYVTESSKDYPISINGKVRANITIALDADEATVHEIVLTNETVKKWLEGNAPKKIVFVKGRMINVVL